MSDGLLDMSVFEDAALPAMIVDVVDGRRVVEEEKSDSLVVLFDVRRLKLRFERLHSLTQQATFPDYVIAR